MLVKSGCRIILGVHDKCECRDLGAVCPSDAVEQQASAYSLAAVARGNGEPGQCEPQEPEGSAASFLPWRELESGSGMLLVAIV